MATYNPAGAGTYTLAASIGSTDATIILNSFVEPVTGTPYTMVLLNTSVVYATIAPKTVNSEFISFTGITQNADGTATLTGVTRGLAKKYPFTTDSTYKLPHSGQTQFILSDAPQVFIQYVNNTNDYTINGLWTFVQTPIGLNPGAVQDAAVATKGIVFTSVAPASAIAPTVVGINDPRFANYAASATGTDAYAITLSSAPSAYATGQIYYFKADVANTGACTLNVNALGAKSLKVYGLDPRDNYIKIGSLVQVQYDGTNMQILSVSAQPQVSQDGNEIYVADASGSSTAYTATLTPAINAYVTGMVVRVKIGLANTTTTPTLNINALGAKTIIKGASTALAIGDIVANMFCIFIYDGTNMVLQTPAANPTLTTSYFEATMSVAGSTGNAAFTKVSFDTVTFDNLSEFSTANKRFVAANAGKYLFNAQVSTANNGTNTIGIAIYKNGSVYRMITHGDAAATGQLSISVEMSLVATDFVEVFTGASGVSLTINNSLTTLGQTATVSFFSGFRIA